MTYKNDPNANRPSHPMTKDDSTYTGWLVGAAVAIAVIIGIFFMTGRPTGDSTATNSSPATSTRPLPNMPTTTGSGVVQPNNPPSSVPTAPTPR